jgi:putative addiction module antidote
MPATTSDHIGTFRRIGNSVGLTFPKDVLERAGFDADSQVHIVETPDGLMLRRFDASFDAVMEGYRVGAAQYRNALRELSK